MDAPIDALNPVVLAVVTTAAAFAATALTTAATTKTADACRALGTLRATA